jgi:hypothetical protein
MANNKIMVQRETYVKGDKTFFSYYVKGNVRGKDIKVAVIPPDKGGYTVLDIVFGDNSACELVPTPFEMKTESGQVIKGNTFTVRSVDKDGTVYECKVQPSRSSDKALLNMMLR